MSVELTDLYKDISSDYEVRLLTDSCFDKQIDWVHIIEDDDFVSILHGEELIFNSSLNYETDEARKRFITNLITAQAGGLIMATQKITSISHELIDYCNRKQFPLFWANWNTSYLNIMRRLSKILIANERIETNLASAFKNAISYPENDKLYSSHFDRNGFPADAFYTVCLLEFNQISASHNLQKLRQIQKSLRYYFKKSICFEDSNNLTLLICDCPADEIKKTMYFLTEKYSELRISIGSRENHIHDIHFSYERAVTTYRLKDLLQTSNVFCYDDLGLYQLLTDVKTPSIYPAFLNDVLGKLIEYDKINKTNYMEILICFFRNDCHLGNTADELFFHKNTLKYKMKKIREVLGYDILSNQNRMKIMVALHIYALDDDFYNI